MRLILLWFLLVVSCSVSAQVFQRPFDNAASMAIGGATIAMPNTNVGLANEAVLGQGDRRGVVLSAAMPYALGDWQVGQFQGFTKLTPNSGVGMSLQHSAIDGYGEQNVRLQYGRRLGAKISIGAGVDFYRVWADEYATKKAFTFGVSLLAEPVKNLILAFRVNNPFHQSIAENVPSNVLRVGFAWKTSPLLMILGETEKDLERAAQLKIGFEYKAHKALLVRVGMRTTPVRACFGVGLPLKNGLRLDFGSEIHSALGVTPAAAIKWSIER